MRTKLQNINEANCSLAREFEEVVQCKDDEIAELKRQLASTSIVVPTLRATAPDVDDVTTGGIAPVERTVSGARHGRAPPVDPYSGVCPARRPSVNLESVDRGGPVDPTSWTPEGACHSGVGLDPQAVLHHCYRLPKRTFRSWGANVSCPGLPYCLTKRRRDCSRFYT